MKRLLIAAMAGCLSTMPVYADEKHHQGDKSGGGASQAPASMADGEVRRVDKDAKKITIRHGPIQNLDMPAHTMVFQVKENAMLDQVKPGDKVRFQAEKVGGAFMLTMIQLAQ